MFYHEHPRKRPKLVARFGKQSRKADNLPYISSEKYSFKSYTIILLWLLFYRNKQRKNRLTGIRYRVNKFNLERDVCEEKELSCLQLKQNNVINLLYP